jgi:hypothetical protein
LAGERPPDHRSQCVIRLVGALLVENRPTAGVAIAAAVIKNEASRCRDMTLDSLSINPEGPPVMLSENNEGNRGAM